MTTLCIQDGSTKLQADIKAAQDFMEREGIKPLHQRIGASDGYVPLHVCPGVPVAAIVKALAAAGLECVQHGGRYVVRERG